MDSMTKPHGNKGRKQSPEHIAKRVAARRAKGNYSNNGQERDEVKVKQRAATKAAWERGVFANRPKFEKHSPETIERMREVRRQMWADGRYEDRKPSTRRAVSEMERSLAPYLATMGFRHTEERDCFIACEDRTRMPDYVNFETREVFEFFGCFWHHPDDEQRWIEEYAKKGWTCTVLWEDELRDWLEQHQDLVDPETHEVAMKTSRARHRYPQRGNDQIKRASTAL
jgi:G:T-mismatch repair DNA endonuclease (very short patch repair protein)